MKKSPLPLIALLTTLFSLPLFVYAVDAGQGFNTLGGLVNTFTNTIVKSLATLFATAAMAAFFYGIVEYIWGFREGKQEVITNGQRFMGWSIIALFVMFSVWGIVKYAQGIFGISNQSTIVIPSIQLGNGNNSDQSSGGPGMFQGAANSGIPTGGGAKSTQNTSNPGIPTGGGGETKKTNNFNSDGSSGAPLLFGDSSGGAGGGALQSTCNGTMSGNGNVCITQDMVDNCAGSFDMDLGQCVASSESESCANSSGYMSGDNNVCITPQMQNECASFSGYIDSQTGDCVPGTGNQSQSTVGDTPPQGDNSSNQNCDGFIDKSTGECIVAPPGS